VRYILEAELAGVVRYTHYSLLVFGHNRIPIVSWMREQAAESLTHAQQAGEMITLLGEYPSLTNRPPASRLHFSCLSPES
jgi:bacterioferritin